MFKARKLYVNADKDIYDFQLEGIVFVVRFAGLLFCMMYQTDIRIFVNK